jgi:hypothetical protein
VSVHDYVTAAAYLAGGRNRDSRPIGNNTRVERRGENIAIRLHGTDVLTYHPDGGIELNTNGWRTSTTKSRINEYVGPCCRVFQRDHVWYVHDYDYGTDEEFFDGMVVR